MTSIEQDQFIELASKLRELGATQVTHGAMSVTFAAPPKVVTLPVAKPAAEAPPGVERVREWRDGDGHVVVNPEPDLNTREGRDAKRLQVLKQMGLVE